MLRTPKQLMVGAFLVACATAACAQSKVHIKSEKKELKDGTFTVTIVLDNTGATAAEDYLVTTQPYNVLKEKGAPNFDATTTQAQFVTIGPGAEIQVQRRRGEGLEMEVHGCLCVAEYEARGCVERSLGSCQTARRRPGPRRRRCTVV